MATLNLSLKYALKEWAIAVEALTRGETILLIRKGGIRERGFQVKHEQVWLYPTYEHQKSALLKPEYAESVTEVEPGWHPEQVEIKSCAQITEVLTLHNPACLPRLQPHHIWNEQMIDERLKWKPQNPLLLLLLRVYRLPKSQLIPFDAAYGGCKSWIELKPEIDPSSLVPILSETEYLKQTQAIRASVLT